MLDIRVKTVPPPEPPQENIDTIEIDSWLEIEIEGSRLKEVKHDYSRFVFSSNPLLFNTGDIIELRDVLQTVIDERERRGFCWDLCKRCRP